MFSCKNYKINNTDNNDQLAKSLEESTEIFSTQTPTTTTSETSTNFDQRYEYVMNTVYVDNNGKQVYNKPTIQKISILRKEKNKETQLKWKDVLNLWKNKNKAFMDFFIDILKKSVFGAYYLEFVPLIDEGSNYFEFVLYQTKLDNPANGNAFGRNHENMTIDGGVISFENTSGGVRLIVPTNKNLLDDTFAHIANFSKRAPMEQQYKLWRLTSEEILEYIKKNKKTFISTDGNGVAWLHVRVESSPRYFSYPPYKG